ncbi:hypothetical protein [Erwinia mallotivora]|nr:hypothetical protein [Erwinia mallotivora]
MSRHFPDDIPRQANSNLKLAIRFSNLWFFRDKKTGEAGFTGLY